MINYKDYTERYIKMLLEKFGLIKIVHVYVL